MTFGVFKLLACSGSLGCHKQWLALFYGVSAKPACTMSLRCSCIWLASVIWGVSGHGLHCNYGVSVIVACSASLGRQAGWLAQALWFCSTGWLAQPYWYVCDYGLHGIYGVSSFLACTEYLGCPRVWLAHTLWGVYHRGLLLRYGVSPCVAGVVSYCWLPRRGTSSSPKYTTVGRWLWGMMGPWRSAIALVNPGRISSTTSRQDG